MSPYGTAKKFFPPVGLQEDTVSSSSSSRCSLNEPVHIKQISCASCAAMAFVSFSSQLYSLKSAPKNIFFFLIHLAEALTLLFHAALLQNYISFNRVFKTHGGFFLLLFLNHKMHQGSFYPPTHLTQILSTNYLN